MSSSFFEVAVELLPAVVLAALVVWLTFAVVVVFEADEQAAAKPAITLKPIIARNFVLFIFFGPLLLFFNFGVL